MKNKPLVIYHKNCMDGLAAAWCFWALYGDSMEYHAGSYGEPVPDIVDRSVFLVDFSYKRDKMIDICDFAESVVVLDHHKTAIDDLKDLSKEFDNLDLSFCTIEKSGARIAWDYIQEKVLTRAPCEPPPFLAHVEDRDLWQFKLKDTKAIIRAASERELNLPGIAQYMNMSSEELSILTKTGDLLLRADLNLIDSISKECVRWITLEVGNVSYELPLINAPGSLFSEMGNLLSFGGPAVAMYYDTREHRVFGLRSDKIEGLDVSEIAKNYGGGGHKNAAGFKVDRNHYLAKI